MDINFDLVERKYAKNLLEFMTLVLQKQDLERMTSIQKILSHEGFYIPHHDPELVYKYHLHTVKLDDLFIENVYRGTVLQYYDYDITKKIDLIFASDYNIALFVNLSMKNNNQFIDMMKKLSIYQQDYLMNVLKPKIKSQIYDTLNKKLNELHRQVMKLDDVIKIKDDIDDMIFQKVKKYYSENLELTKGGSNYISFLKYDPRGTLGGKEGYYLNMMNFGPLIEEIDKMLRSKMKIRDERYEIYFTNNSLWFLKQAAKLKKSLSNLYVNVNGLPAFIEDSNVLLIYLQIIFREIPDSQYVNNKSMENDIMIRFCILICIIGHLCGNNIGKFAYPRSYMKLYYKNNEPIMLEVAKLIKSRLIHWMPITTEPYRHTYITMISVIDKLNLLCKDDESVNNLTPKFKFLSTYGMNLKTNLILASNYAVVILQQICSTDQFQLADLLINNIIDPSYAKNIVEILSDNFSSYNIDDVFVKKYTSLHSYHTKIVDLVYDLISYNMTVNIQEKIQYFTKISIDHCI